MRPWRAASAAAGVALAAAASVAPPARRRRVHAITGAFVFVLAACAGRPGPRPVLPYDPVRETVLVRDVATGFIAGEARGDETADTLLVPGADFVMSGIPVTRRPRLAGVLGRGTATIEDLRTQLAGEFAWVVAVYRWAEGGGDDVERGRATMILERRSAGWRIRHVHSSTVAPWR